ncbi:unnamed protein product, partial [Nesidiocoris tenuis]
MFWAFSSMSTRNTAASSHLLLDGFVATRCMGFAAELKNSRWRAGVSFGLQPFIKVVGRRKLLAFQSRTVIEPYRRRNNSKTEHQCFL